jgi:hypothetical protein
LGSRTHGAPGSYPLVIETCIEMLKQKLKYISSLLRLDTSVDTFLRAWTSNVYPLVGQVIIRVS